MNISTKLKQPFGCFNFVEMGRLNSRVKTKPIRDYRVSLFVLLFDMEINKNIRQLPRLNSPADRETARRQYISLMTPCPSSEN